MLKRFNAFLTSPIVLNCCSAFEFGNADFNDSKLMKKFLRLGESFGISNGMLTDEIAIFRNEHVFSNLADAFKRGIVDKNNYPVLHRLLNSAMLICPHNMNVESGFSIMKASETIYQNNFSGETYDAVRVVRAYFSREQFEAFTPSSELIEKIANAGRSYKNAMIDKANQNRSTFSEAVTMRDHFGIYRERNAKELRAEEIKADREIEEAEKTLREAKKKREDIAAQRQAETESADQISANVLNNMFRC